MSKIDEIPNVQSENLLEKEGYKQELDRVLFSAPNCSLLCIGYYSDRNLSLS